MRFVHVSAVSMNSDVSDSWEREDDNYFETYAWRGYALGVNVAIWVLTLSLGALQQPLARSAG